MTNLVANKLTPQREAINLYHHGTVKWDLTPNAVYQTAVRDLQSFEFNAWLRGERARYDKKSPDYKNLPRSRGYGFSAQHVGKAQTPAMLLEFALQERKKGKAGAQNVNTLALYDDVDTLEKAYALALGTGT